MSVSAGVTLNNSQSSIFNGTTAQNISGGGTANFNGGLQVNKTGTLTLSQNISVLNGLTLTAGTIDFGSNTVNLSGNLSNNATLTASASTLNITGTTSMSGSTTSLNNLTISGSGILNAPATLNIGRDFTNNGTFNASTGNLVFNGSVAQAIGGTTASSFYDITSNSLSTVTVSTNQNITGILSVNSGIFDANGRLTLISTASGDAQIGAIAGTVNGNVIVQRYLPNTSTVKAYRYLASPVTGATVADWKLSFPITGTFTDPSTQAEWVAIPNINSATPSMFVYNEPKGGVLGARYDTYPVNGTSTASSALTNGTGYAAFVRQTAAISLNVTGPIRQGNNVTVPVTNTFGDPTDDGWNLIGNPFAAPINWDNVTLPAGLSAQIAFKDNTGNITTAGNYVNWTQGNPGTGTSGFAGTIPSGQAFWVRFTTAASSTNIIFKEADKQVIRNPKFVRQEALSSIIRAKVSGNGKDDELIIRFAENAKDELDQKFDAQKLRNDFLNFSSLSADNLKMAINGLSPINCGTSAGRKEIPLLVEGFSSTTVLTPNAYKISFSQLETLDQQLKVVLKDSFNGDSLSVSLTSSTYQFNVTADAKSFGAKRFKLVITCPAIVTALPDEIIEREIKIYPNPTNGSLQIQLPSELDTKVFVLNSIGEILGRVSMTEEGGYQKGQFELNDYSSGVYLVKIFNGNKVVTKKVIRK